MSARSQTAAGTVIRPALLDDLPDSGHVVIEASAGTGKTFALECLVVHLLATGVVTFDEILVVTFTDKATEELRGRLRVRLETLADYRGDGWSLDDTERQRLHRAAGEFETGTISTIHGWCSKVLEENAFYQHRLFEETLVDGRERFRHTYRRQLRTLLVDPGRLGVELRTSLEKGVTLRYLEEVAVQLAETRAKITPQLNLSDLQQAAATLVVALPRALLTLVPQVKSRFGASTAAALLRHLNGLLETAQHVAVAEAPPFDQHDAIRRWYKPLQRHDTFASLLRAAPAASEVDRRRRDELVAAIDDLQRQSCSRLAFVTQRLEALTTLALREEKAALGQHDYDDLLRLLVEALRGPSGGPLLAGLRQRYRVVLIDEFQDTDEVQWEIFRRIFFESPDGHRLFLIGDPKQAIYGFRNADVCAYRRARAEILGDHGASFDLVDNFRSTDQLVTAHNHLFTNFFDGGIQFLAGHSGRSSLATLTADGETVAPIGLLPVENREDLSDRLPFTIGHEILRLVTEETLRLQDETGVRSIEFDDVQILTRSRSEAVLMGKVLARLEIPYVFYGQEGLYQSAELGDLAALFAAIAQPSHSAKRGQAWLTPFFNVELSDLPTLQDTVNAAPGHPYPARLFRWHHLARSGDLGRLFDAIMEESGVVRRALFTGGQSRRLTNYQHLFEELSVEGTRLGTDVQELPDRLARLSVRSGSLPGNRDQQRLDHRSAAVRILTVHKAKGLEAPIVFLYGGWSSPIESLPLYHQDEERCVYVGSPPPSIRHLAEAETQAEAQRLVYVGVTRAAHRLYLPFAAGRFQPKENTFYWPLNHRLAQLRASSQAADLFAEIPLLKRGPTAPGPSLTEVVSWSPSATCFTDSAWTPERLESLRRDHAAVFVTSYTQLSDQRPPVSFEPAPSGSAEALPGGRATGIFLHELLERIDLERVAAVNTDSSVTVDECKNLFGADPTASLFSHLAQRHAIDPEFWHSAQRLTFSALRSPIDLPALSLPAGLATAQRAIRELEFLFPTPPNRHATGSVAPIAYPVGRGYVQGVVDLLFQQGDHYFVLDWKSDRLDAWDSSTLSRHVANHYQTQARLYTLALQRILEIESKSAFEAKFGGVLYCFLRGMDLGTPNRGVYFERPSWNDTLQWSRDLEWIDDPSAMGSTAPSGDETP